MPIEFVPYPPAPPVPFTDLKHGQLFRFLPSDLVRRCIRQTDFHGYQFVDSHIVITMPPDDMNTLAYPLTLPSDNSNPTWDDLQPGRWARGQNGAQEVFWLKWVEGDQCYIVWEDGQTDYRSMDRFRKTTLLKLLPPGYLKIT